MEINSDQDVEHLNEDTSSRGERTAGEVLTTVEMDLAYASEKVLILEMLLMRVTGSTSQSETVGNEDSSSETLANAFESDLLSGILISEIKSLEGFMTSLQVEITDAHNFFCQRDNFDDIQADVEARFHRAEKSLKHSQVLVADLRMQAENFEKTLTFGGPKTKTGTCNETEDVHISSSSKWKLQTVDQQRDILQTLEKSLARELDLDQKLSDLRDREEELKVKLHYAEQEAYWMEDSVDITLERMLEAENASTVLVGISKDLSEKLQTVQVNLDGALQRECQMESKLQEALMKLSAGESALARLKESQADLDSSHVLQENSLGDRVKETEDKCALASSEASTLREKVTLLEEKLRESESQLHLAETSVESSEGQQAHLHSELRDMKNVIKDLRENVTKAESRAASAEEKCTLLTQSNTDLNEELGVLRNSGTDKANILERKLKESDTQLEHAKASVEAIEEQQNMLYSALTDMENLIEDLKGKVSKAEFRAESAESKCTLLTETNLELNEELGFLRGKLASLEALHQTDDAKVAAAKDIGIRTKVITDLVMKLASERERLQLQISTLSKKNKVLSEKCLITKDNIPGVVKVKGTNTANESSIPKPSEAVSSATSFQVDKSATITSASETSTGTVVSSAEDDSLSALSKLETVRTIEVTQLGPKYLCMAFVVVLVSATAIYLFQLENH